MRVQRALTAAVLAALALTAPPDQATAGEPDALATMKSSIIWRWRSLAPEAMPAAGRKISYLDREFEIGPSSWAIQFTLFEDADATRKILSGPVARELEARGKLIRHTEPVLYSKPGKQRSKAALDAPAKNNV